MINSIKKLVKPIQLGIIVLSFTAFVCQNLADTKTATAGETKPVADAYFLEDAKSIVAAGTTAQGKPRPRLEKVAAAAATRITSVNATPLEKRVVIRIKADGTIKDYKYFALPGSPSRIVYDMYGLKSDFKTEQRITVKSELLSNIRHYGHPEKVRMVLETQGDELPQFTASPVDNGLLVYVGQTSKISTVSNPAEAEPVSAQVTRPNNPEEKKISISQVTQPATTSKNADFAWLNRIDFASEEAGKSAVIVGTTRPVKYQITKISDKRLRLELLNTNLPEYRNRALITTRFQSAVDRITPSQQSKTKDTIIIIDLREEVPYLIKQTDSIIKVDFAASSIPPKPYEDAKLPAWKRVLAEPGAEDSVSTEKKAKKTKKISERNLGQKSSTVAGEKGLIVEESGASKEFDLASQKKKDLYSGEEKSIDLFGHRVAKLYEGEPIALDFYDTDIKNVFRIIREISGKNFAIDKNVTGKVTLTLDKPVPWDQVLDLVLKMNSLEKKMEGDIIRIATVATLKAEEKLDKEKLAELQKRKKEEPLITAFMPINYASAEEVAGLHIEPLISPTRKKDGASVTVDKRLSMIILTDVPEVIKRAKEIIERIDLVTPQVIIEARIVEANSAFTRDLGFDWGTISAGPFNIGDATLTLTGLASNLPAAIPSAVVGGTFQKLAGTPFEIIDAQLVASETEGKTNIISAPKIVTLNNSTARIKQGLEVPYLERDSSGNATVRFKDVDLLLEVTPNITPDDRIVLSVFVTKNDVVDPTADQPALSTNEAQTELLVDNGDTIVIGGIVKSTLQYGEKGIPGLRDLGVLGWLFKSQSKADSKNELLIFITPRIVKLAQKEMNI
jgi:type IV pilus assembly protein PilQ